MSQASWQRSERGELIDQEVEAISRRIHVVYVNPGCSFIKSDTMAKKQKEEAQLVARLTQLRESMA